MYAGLVNCAENGVVMVLWIGQQFGADSVQKLFGVPSLAQIQTENMVSTHDPPHAHSLYTDSPVSVCVRVC